jgi:hypothetical protein
MRASWIAAGLALALASPRARAEEPFGALGPAVLPSGGMALGGLAGYPEVRAAFRQGLHGLELGGEAGFDYLQVKVWAVGALRTEIAQGGGLQIGLALEGGFFADGGASGSDDYNQGGSGLRLGVGAVLSYKTDWPLALMAFLRLPLEVPLTDGGTLRVAGLAGGGAEVGVGSSAFVSLQGAFGPELRRIQGTRPASLSSSQDTRLFVQAAIGVGFRLF